MILARKASSHQDQTWSAPRVYFCMQVGHAEALLEGMQFYAIPDTLLAAGRPQAVVTVLLRLIKAAEALGTAFFRSAAPVSHPPVSLLATLWQLPCGIYSQEPPRGILQAVQTLEADHGSQVTPDDHLTPGCRAQLRGMASLLSQTLMGRMEGEAKTLVRPFQEALHTAASSGFAIANGASPRLEPLADGSQVRTVYVFHQ